MSTQRAIILDRLADQGWSMVAAEQNLEWWADEILRLESVWSPVGSPSYITFLVDPMAEQHRKEGIAVWAACASLTKPTDRLSAEQGFTLSLGHGWEQRLPELFNYLAVLRGQDIADIPV